MRASATALALVLPLALAGPVLPPAGTAGAAATSGTGAAPGDERAVSRPVEDSYYPAKGDPTVDALHYDLDLTWLRKARTLRGVATIDLRVARDDVVLKLDLSRRLDVTSVHLDGEQAAFRHEGNHLVVPALVDEGERRTVRVTYRGTPGPAAGPASRPDIARLGMRVTRDGWLWTMQEPFGAFTWYPVNDHPSDKALYTVRVSAPGRWVGVSNGTLASRRTRDGRTVTRWTNRDPMPAYLLTLAVGPYRAFRQTGPRGLPITHWVPRDEPELVRPLLSTPAAVRWLEKRLGRYPFESAGVVLTPGDSAMETQTMVTFGTDNFGLGARHVRSTVVHELAHHWWGNAVTPSQWRDLWMNEGMATYLQARWDAEHGGPAEAFRWTLAEWTASDQWYRDLYGPPGRFERGEFGSVNVYYSAALMWEHLRRQLGSATFHRLTRRWPQSRLHTNSDRDALVRWWSEQAGRDLEPFFHRWLDSRRSPA